MDVDWFGPVKKGLSFSVEPGRWLPVFAVNAAFGCGFLWMLSHLLQNLIITDAGFPAYYMIFAFLMAVVWWLLRIWIDGAIVAQTHGGKNSVKPWHYSLKRYPSILGASLMVSVLSFVAYLIPFFGAALSILVSVIFFFFLQQVVIGGEKAESVPNVAWLIFTGNIIRKTFTTANVLIIGAISAITSCAASFVLFIHGPAAFALFSTSLFFIIFPAVCVLAFSRTGRAMFISSAVSVLIALASAAPMLAVFLGMLEIASFNLPGMMIGLPETLSLAMGPLTAACLILMLGISVSRVFILKAQTEFYLQFSGKRRHGG
jgi:hypothetical protein